MTTRNATLRTRAPAANSSIAGSVRETCLGRCIWMEGWMLGEFFAVDDEGRFLLLLSEKRDVGCLSDG
jgi:hypothetical protein